MLRDADARIYRLLNDRSAQGKIADAGVMAYIGITYVDYGRKRRRCDRIDPSG